MIFRLLFYVQVVSLCLSYDIKLEGAIHFGNDLIRSLSSDFIPFNLRTSEGSLEKPSFQLMAAEPSDKEGPLNYMTQELVDENLVIKDGKIINKDVIPKMVVIKPMMIEPIEKNYDKFRFNFKNQLVKNGCLRLKELAHFIKNTTSPITDINSILKNATNDYLNDVNEYYNFNKKIHIKNRIDKEFVTLDMLESTNKILITKAKTLLDAFIKITNNAIIKVNVPKLMETIQNIVLAEKTDQYRYICKTLNVCRPFPGYSDRIADLLSNILQLTDSKLKEIIINFNEILTDKQGFFKTLLRDNVFNTTSSKFSKAFKDITYMREVVSMLRGVITQRNKVFQSKNMVLKVRTKALRILLDLIDNAFDVNADKNNIKEIENALKSYKQWASGERQNLNLIIKKFIYNVVEVLNNNWESETKEEVNVLTDIIFTGDTKNKEVYNYLFTKGSVMLRDEDIRTNIGY